jgi:ABC-type Fe3+/spermidine/putrescine transport system ATPase subunit
MDGCLKNANAAPGVLDAETRVPVFEIRSASKYFGGVTALQAVSLDVHAAEIVAIVGDNGAGKSTLIKGISGTQPPEEGTFFFRGQPVEIKNLQDASRLGIETVYQDLALCDNLDTVQNLFLGNEIISSDFNRSSAEARGNGEILGRSAPQSRRYDDPFATDPGRAALGRATARHRNLPLHHEGSHRCAARRADRRVRRRAAWGRGAADQETEGGQSLGDCDLA